MKVFSLCTILSFLLWGQYGIEKPKDYVLLEYGGMTDKAVPMLAFSMENFDRMTIRFGYISIVSKCEYLSAM